MDDGTKKIIIGLAAGAIKKVLLTAGSAAAAHGIITDVPAETYSALALTLVTAGFSFWNDYGKAIVGAQLEVLKARSLAAAAKIKTAGLPPVTPAEIAAQSPKLTAESVTKVAATLPADVQASVIPINAVPRQAGAEST
jgi:predicted carbohydrate-binding protein with CBM5 and CBM33 domain